MAERLTGIEVREEAGGGQPIARAPTDIAAFVGRTLRGPLNRPVMLHGFADFERVFGGLWQPSMLSYAVEQYFDNGGGRAVVVRVANGARSCSLSLPAGGELLQLRALAPGTREFLRAAVDYDGIGDNEPDRFNLVLQRLRSPASEHIEEQEIYRRLTVEPGGPRFVADALLDSELVRLSGPAPAQRPDPTLPHGGGRLAAYVGSDPDGDDGGPLTDYDIIGSAADGTGLFSLDRVDHLNFLCIPPLARDVDVGASTLLVASRYCRDRRALLVLDPPSAWDSPGAAVAGARDWGFASENAVMYYPRLLALDRLRGRFESFGSAGAAAGLLARADGLGPPWSGAASDMAALRPGMRPLCVASEADRDRLASLGINVLPAARATAGTGRAACTLAGPWAGSADWRDLGRRRLALLILDSVERGTRWMLFEPNGPALWSRAAAQLRAFMDGLEAEGAFADVPPAQRWFVICDERVNREQERAGGAVNLLFGFAAAQPGQYHSFLLSHRAGGSRLRPLALDRAQAERAPPETLLRELDRDPLPLPLARAG